MNNNQNIPEEIKEDIISFLSSKLTSNQSDRLLKWLSQSTENKKFFDQITDIWHLSSSLSHAEEFDPIAAWDDVTTRLKRYKKQNRSEKRIYWIRPALRIASVVIIMLLSGLLMRQYFVNGKDSHGFVEMIAPKGSRSEIVLADGSKVWLNSGSKIRFSNAFGKTSRKLDLEGEAYFSVAKNKKIPFIVHASDLNIIAVGTAFNVKAYTDENTVETTLEEGSVRIEPLVKPQDAFNPIVLEPSQKAMYYKQTLVEKEANNKKSTRSQVLRTPSVQPEKIEIDRLQDTKPYTSWKEKRWLFQHETLESLVHKLERRYDIKVTFADEASKNYSFSGSLYDESIEQVLEAIKIIAPIDFKMDHKNIEISTNRYLKEKYEKLQKQ